MFSTSNQSITMQVTNAMEAVRWILNRKHNNVVKALVQGLPEPAVNVADIKSQQIYRTDMDISAMLEEIATAYACGANGDRKGHQDGSKTTLRVKRYGDYWD
eukprot:3247632-Rhodomonas_salina.1